MPTIQDKMYRFREDPNNNNRDLVQNITGAATGAQAGNRAGQAGSIAGAQNAILMTKPGDNSYLSQIAGLTGKQTGDLLKWFGDGGNYEKINQALTDVANLSLSNAGLFTTYEQGLEEVGVGKDGKKLYIAPEVKNNPNNFKAGKNQLNEMGTFLDSIGAFGTKEDANKFATATNKVGDPAFISQLDKSLAAGDKTSALNALTQTLQIPGLEKLVADPNDPSGMKNAQKHLSTMAGIVGTFNNWDKMNVSQKSLALSGLAMSAYQYMDGSDLTSKVLVQSSTANGPKMTVGDAMGLFGAGVDVYSMMRNWDQLDALQRITYGTGTVSQMAAMGKQMGLFGQGVQGGGQAVGNVSAAQLGAAGYQSSPAHGIGALIGKPGSTVPQGYTAVGQNADGSLILAPESVADSSSAFGATVQGVGAAANFISAYQAYKRGDKVGAGINAIGGTGMAIGAYGQAVGSASLSTTGAYVGGAAGVAAGAYTVYQGWGKGGSEGAMNGAVGGTAMAAGLYTMGMTNPYALGAVVAVSVLSNTIEMNEKTASTTSMMAAGAGTGAAIGSVVPVVGTAIGAAAGAVIGGVYGYTTGGGKSEDQQGRDKVRSVLKDRQLIDNDWHVTLADGSKANVGVDGHGGRHEFRFKDKVPAGNEVRELNAYDVDYTNDLDYSANMGTTALLRLTFGGKGKPIDQFAGQLANASISNIGFGQDMTPENFAKMQANLRGFYAQSGIKSKEEAYALANVAFSEGRMTEMDLISTHQGINMAFDDKGYDTAQQLMAGRWKGVEVAHQIPQAPGPNFKFKAVEGDKLPGAKAPSSAGVSASAVNYDLVFEPGTYKQQPDNSGTFFNAMKEYELMFQNTQSFMKSADMTKEQLRQVNQKRYA